MAILDARAYTDRPAHLSEMTSDFHVVPFFLLPIDLTGVPYLTLWSDGGPFLCIEPCWGLTDHHEQRAFEDKKGIQTIPPGGELHGSFSMTPQLASCD
jgi:galactose mutarotase-like enzyme